MDLFNLLLNNRQTAKVYASEPAMNTRGKKTQSVYIYGMLDRQLGISSEQVAKTLSEVDAEVINLHLNSGGGCIFEAKGVQSLLRNHSARVIGNVDALCASASTFLLSACDERRMSENAWLMIHSPWSHVSGNASELRKQADMLDSVREQMVSEYEKMTGNSKEQISAWLDEEKWFDHGAALANKFIDHVNPSIQEKNLNFDLAAYARAPEAICPKPIDIPPQAQKRLEALTIGL